MGSIRHLVSEVLMALFLAANTLLLDQVLLKVWWWWRLWSYRGGVGTWEGGGGEDLVPTMPRCVCPKVKDIYASRE